MTYATEQGLIDRFGELELVQLTDRTNTPPTTVNSTIVSQALDDADALVDSYIGKPYALPLAQTPPVLVKLASDIARKFLHGDRANKDHPVTLAYNEAVSWLKDVARGLVKLDDGTGDDPSAAGGGKIKTDAPDRVMTRDSLSGY